jgi:hypothetical protein
MLRLLKTTLRTGEAPVALFLVLQRTGDPGTYSARALLNVAMITAYEPDPEEWIQWRIRKGERA